MKRLFCAAIAALTLFSFTACQKEPAPKEFTAEELKPIFQEAITAARDEEINQVLPILSSSEDEGGALIFDMVGLTDEDIKAAGISISPMNIKAYGVAIIAPAEGKTEAVQTGLDNFVKAQQQSFANYLPDQGEIANSAILTTREDGIIVLVMCEDAQTVYDSITATLDEKLK